MIIDSPIISGSYAATGSLNQTGNVVITGSLTVTGTINGSITGSITTASYALNAETLDGLDSTSFTTTSSFNTVSGSFSTRITDLESFSSSLDATFATDAQLTAVSQSFSSSLSTVSGSLASRVANNEATGSSLTTASSSFSTRVTNNESNISSLQTASGSFSTRTTNLETASGSFSTRVTSAEGSVTSLNSKTGSYATTGSNAFNGSQTITGSLTTTGQIIAQTINVQQVTSSIVYSSGSNIFGNSISNTQQFTGSVSASGSLIINNSVLYVGGTNIGIGGTNPNSAKLVIYGSAAAASNINLLDLKNGSDGGIKILFSNSVAAELASITAGVTSTGAGTDDGTLIFSTAADAVSTEKMRITSGGSVGIGSTSPAYKLDVAGNGRFTSTLSATKGYFEDSSGAGAVLEAYNTVATNATTAIIRQTGAGGNGNQDIGLLVDIQGAADSDRIANFRYYNGSTYTSRMVVLRNGNVGIGSTSPAYKLDVNGTINSSTSTVSGTGSLNLGTTSESRIAGIITATASPSYSATSKIGFSVTTWGAGSDYGPTEVMAIDMRGADSKNPVIWMNPFGGSVGIGTTSPNNIFTIYAASSAIYTQWIQSGTGTTSTDGLRIGLDASSNGIINLNEGTALITSVDGSERMRITNGGNVGIGTTSPASTLQVDASGGGLIRATRTGAGSGYIQMEADGTNGTLAANNTLYFNAGGGTKMTILSGGNVGIGTTSPAEKLEVAGNIRLGGTSAYNSVSVYNSGASGGGGFLAYQNGVVQAFFGALGWYEGNTNVGTVIGTDSASRPIVFYTSTERMRITGGGNVGIGTTSPTLGKLQITGDNNQLALHTAGTYSSIYFYNAGNDRAGIYVSDTETHFEGRGTSGLFFGGAVSQNHMIITSGGNVGINTTSPATKLQISGVNNDSYGQLRLLATGTGADAQISFETPLNGRGIYVDDSDTNKMKFYTGAGKGTGDMVTFDNSGNVGIGSTSPLRKLVVGGDTNIKGSIVMGGITDSGGLSTGVIYMLEGQGIAWYNSAFNAGRASIQGTSAGHIVLSPTANVGIGTTSPSYLLHVAGTGYFGGTVGFEGEGNGLTIDTGYGNNGRVGLMKYGGLEGMLVAGNTTVLRLGHRTDSDYVATSGAATIRVDMLIATGGNIGIGTTSPSAHLHVHASGGPSLWLTAGGSGTGGLRIIKGDSGTAYINNQDSVGMQFQIAGSTKMTIDSGGNVGIGTTSPNARLDLGGSYGANGEKFLIYNDNSSSALAGTKVGFYMDRFGLSNNSTFVFPTISGAPGSFIISSKDTSGTTLVARMTVLGESGNVGIGTTSPLAKFHTDGNGFFRNPGAAGYTVHIGSISPGNVGDRYLHVQLNTIGSMMLWVKVFGYVYTTNVIEGLGGGYVGGGTGGLDQAFQNGAIVAQYQNSGYVEIVVDTVNTATTNRWGSITFLGGTDSITTIQPLEIRAYSWTSTTTRVY